MSVRLVLAAAEQHVRAVEVEGLTVKDALRQIGAWEASGVWVPAVVVGVAPEPNEEIAHAVTKGPDAAFSNRVVVALPEREITPARAPLTRLRSRTPTRVAITSVGESARPGGSLDYLIDFPADAFALAPRLSQLAPVDEGAREVIVDICRVARELGATTIATAVEDPAQRQALAACGVDTVAGPIAGGVAPFSELAALIASQRAVVDPRLLDARLADPLPAGPGQDPEKAAQHFEWVNHDQREWLRSPEAMRAKAAAAGDPPEPGSDPAGDEEPRHGQDG